MSWVRGETGLRRHIQGSSRARGHHGGGALRSEDRQSLASLVVGLQLSVSPDLQTRNTPLTPTYKLILTGTEITAVLLSSLPSFFWVSSDRSLIN